MFKHITERRSDLKKGALRLVADTDGVRMISRNNCGRLYVMKTGKYFGWYDEPPFVTVNRMHERYDYNQ